jgi:hypothetical protein
MQLLAESILLASVSGAAAIIVAFAGQAWINRVLMPGLAWEGSDFDWSMLRLTLGCVILVTFAVGFVPFLQTNVDPADALREGSAHGASERSRLRQVLLVGQVALSTLLLVGAGLFIRSLQQIDRLDVGMETDNAIVATVDFSGTGKTAEEVAAFHERALLRIHELPGVEAASLAATIPLRIASSGGSIQLPEAAARFLDEGRSVLGQ